MGLRNMLGRLNALTTASLRRFRHYLSIAGADEIARRYFIMNGFDGALAIFGVLVGATLTRKFEPTTVIGAGVGVSVAMGISGAWGAYLTERAERLRNLKELEGYIYRSLKGTVLERAYRAVALWVALIAGLSPALTAAIPLMPVALVHGGLLFSDIGLMTSLALNLASLFALGAFLGKASGENVWLHGLLMVASGLATALILIALFGV